MAFILDASVVHAWILDEGCPLADEVKARLHSETATAPALWWFEVRNGLVMAERRGRLTEPETARALRELSSLAISLDQSPDEAGVMTLARQHRLTVYDAAYLELALRKALPLATLDGPLQRAARAEAVRLMGERS